MTELTDVTTTDGGDSSRELSGAEEPPQRRPGRPRSAEAERAIIQATLRLLADEGIAGMSLEGVAALAGVGKTTIYRRWPNKEALILDALSHMKPPLRDFDTGNLRGDITSYLRNVQNVMDNPLAQRLTLRLLGELSGRPTWFTEYLAVALRPNLDTLTGMIERARARGELRADVDPALVTAMIAGPSFYYMLLEFFLNDQPPFPLERYVELMWEGLDPRANPR